MNALLRRLVALSALSALSVLIVVAAACSAPVDVGKDIRKASAMLSSGRQEDAVAYLRGRVKENPDNIHFLNMLGGILAASAFVGDHLVNEERAKEAIVYYERALEQRPGDSLVRYGYAGLLSGLGRTREAVSAFKRAFSDPEFRAHSKYMFGIHYLADALIVLGDIDEMIAEYQRSLEACRYNPHIFSSYLFSLAEAGKTEFAQKELKRYYEEFGFSGKVKWTECHLMKDQNVDDGLRCFLGVAENTNADRDSRILSYADAIRIYSNKMKHHKQAVVLAEKAVGQYPDDARLRFRAGYALYNLREYRKAIKQFEDGRALLRAMPVSENQVNALLISGFASERLGNMKQAEEYYRAVLGTGLRPLAEKARDRLVALEK